MRNILYFLLPVLALSCQSGKIYHVSVSNPSAFDRADEIVSLSTAAFASTQANTDWEVRDSAGQILPSQKTFDGQLIFPVTVSAGQTLRYTLRPFAATSFDTIVRGRQYPERLDDIAWENDRIAFRTYGPALQASGEKAFGYDVWVKNVPHLVVEDRYFQDLNKGISYHTDHGNGLDFYQVGPTLGAGASALLPGDSLIYPYCYDTYEILDNGPLRFTLRLTYRPLSIGADTNVIESRLISLNAGEQLNKVSITYTNLSLETHLGTGLVLHGTAEDFKVGKSFIACADPVHSVNGQLYTAVVFTSPTASAAPIYFGEDEKRARGASGHLLGISEYKPGDTFTYYFGGGWSKGGFPTSADWYAYIAKTSQRIHAPLLVTLH